MSSCPLFFFNDTATTEIYTLSLHDALPIFLAGADVAGEGAQQHQRGGDERQLRRHQGDGELTDAEQAQRTEHPADRKSTRLNSSHANISYAVFCFKKKRCRRIIVVHVGESE